jgi:hypothetical protein
MRESSLSLPASAPPSSDSRKLVEPKKLLPSTAAEGNCGSMDESPMNPIII